MFIMAVMSRCPDTENINTFWVTAEYILYSTSAVDCYDCGTILFSEKQNTIKQDTNNVMFNSWYFAILIFYNQNEIAYVR